MIASPNQSRTREAALASAITGSNQLLRHGAYGNVQTAIALFVSDAPVALVATGNAVTMLRRNSTTSGPDTV